jgi:hypothetical protein
MIALAAATLSSDTLTTAGILLLTLVAVESGGIVMLRIVRGSRPATPFQRSFARAGHAHAGVLVILALVGLLLADGAALDGVDNVLGRNGIWVAAILFPAGFFLSSAGRDRTEPSRFILLLYAGVVSLTVGVVALGIGSSRRSRFDGSEGVPCDHSTEWICKRSQTSRRQPCTMKN